MITTRARRVGTSLTEVLIALFVMALGMVSLLTLFPLGAVQMGQALRDNRCAQAANHADGMVRVWWQTHVVDPNLQTPPVARASFFDLLDTPGAGYTAVASTDSGPSYPLVIDPIGYQARSTALRTWIAKDWAYYTPTLRLSRATVPNINTYADAFAACSLKDDLNFSDLGAADNPQPNMVSRQGRFNWFAVVQRPNNNLRTTANLTVCVFEGRSAGTSSTNAEQVYSAVLLPDTTQVTINVNAAALPPLRVGSWIMDGTITSTLRVANFYRITNITNNGGSWTLDLQTPIRRPPGLPTTSISYTGHIYVFRGLLEVFDRPQLSAAEYQSQTP